MRIENGDEEFFAVPHVQLASPIPLAFTRTFLAGYCRSLYLLLFTVGAKGEIEFDRGKKCGGVSVGRKDVRNQTWTFLRRSILRSTRWHYVLYRHRRFVLYRGYSYVRTVVTVQIRCSWENKIEHLGCSETQKEATVAVILFSSMRAPYV